MASSKQHIEVLLVEPESAFRSALAVAAAPFATVEAHAAFETARPRLEQRRFDLLVSNIRLGAFNGLHLVYIAQLTSKGSHAIVYDEAHDIGLAREAQIACAFYELKDRLTVTLAAYLTALRRLPAQDRRNPEMYDRRSMPRGGRRKWDHYLMMSPPGSA